MKTLRGKADEEARRKMGRGEGSDEVEEGRKKGVRSGGKEWGEKEEGAEKARRRR